MAESIKDNIRARGLPRMPRTFLGRSRNSSEQCASARQFLNISRGTREKFTKDYKNPTGSSSHTPSLMATHSLSFC